MAAFHKISTIHLGVWIHPLADDLDPDHPVSKRQRQKHWHWPAGALLESYGVYLGTTFACNQVP